MATDAQTLINQVAAQGYEKLSKRELIECLLAAAQVGGGGGTPSYQDMQVAWTPTNASAPVFSLINQDGQAGITGLVIKQTSTPGGGGTGDGIQLENWPDLASLLFPNLATCRDLLLAHNPALSSVLAPVLTVINGNLDLSFSPSLTAITFPILQTSKSFALSDSANLVSISLPAFTGMSQLGPFDCFSLSPDVSLANFSFPVYVPHDGEFFFGAGCAFTAASVNHILSRFAANAGYISGNIDVSGGTSAAPSGQGIIDKADLQTRNGGAITVTTN